MTQSHSSFALRLSLALAGVVVLHCSSSPSSPAGGSGNDGLSVDAGKDAEACYPDNDGINGGDYTFDITVDDTGFSKLILTTQNDAKATVTLTNKGTKPHGFVVGCTTTTAPPGCPTKVCFPANSEIAPLAPGDSKTITFDTPTPDNITYPFTSSEPADMGAKGFTGQWPLM